MVRDAIEALNEIPCNLAEAFTILRAILGDETSKEEARKMAEQVTKSTEAHDETRQL